MSENPKPPTQDEIALGCLYVRNDSGFPQGSGLIAPMPMPSIDRNPQAAAWVAGRGVRATLLYPKRPDAFYEAARAREVELAAWALTMPPDPDGYTAGPD